MKKNVNFNFKCMFAIIIIAMVVFGISGCSSDDSDGNTDNGNEVIIDTDAKYAIIVDSSVSEDGTADNQSYTVLGQVIDLNKTGVFPENLTWSLNNKEGDSSGLFPVDSSGKWNGQIMLSSGQNDIVFAISDTEIQERLTVTYNPGYSFGGKLQMNPDVAYVGDTNQVIATIALTDPKTDSSNIRLALISQNGESVVATLTDNGDLANGDEIEGDNIYSCLFNISEENEKISSYRVIVGLQDSSEARSETFNMLVTSHIDDQYFENLLTKQQAYQERLDHTPREQIVAEIDKIFKELESDSDVEQVGKTDSGLGIWIIYKGGIAAVLYSPESGIKGGINSSSSELSGFYTSYYTQSQSIRKLTKAVSENSNTVKSNKALAIAAQYWDWADSDDIPQMKTILENSSCFDVKYVQYNSAGGGSVEDFKNLGDYGIILISSHGDSFYEGLLSLWMDIFGWNGPFGQVILHSNMKATTSNKKTYENDLKKGRLVLWYGNYGITPSFITKYAGSLPNSLVYMSICRGTWNDTLAKAFLGKGAATFLGYDDYVSVSFCQQIGPSLITTLLESGKTMKDAFTSGQTDPSSPYAEFKLFGAADLSLESESFQDGGFESGSISQAWKTEGDARIISNLGNFSPTEGGKMAIISTGLGFTTATGKLSQTICLSTDSCSVSFDWNFLSEEFLEYVGSIFQDSFSVTISEKDNPGNMVSLLDESIDSLSNQVYQVANSFDQGGVYATGWKKISKEIPDSLKGKKVELTFFATDVGDSIYDTAVLIDNIQFSECQ